MRFKSGSKVEVMNKEEVPISWCPAEIISGNGHTYSVRYNFYSSIENEALVERVPRKAIRLCPPAMECMKSWVAGDVVEVFDNNSWKAAVVLKVLGVDLYLARLLGSLQEFKVHRSNIRVPQSWQDDKWLMIEEKTSVQVPQINAKIKLRPEEVKIGGLKESLIISSRTLKRASPFHSSVAESYTGNLQKAQTIEKQGRRQRAVQAPLLEKVDAAAYPKEKLGEIYMHASFNDRSYGCYELGRGKLNDAIGCSLARIPEPIDCDACSVGSCSITSESPNNLPSWLVPFSCQGIDSFCNADESRPGVGCEEEDCTLSPGEEVAASIHKLELHAYCCTLQALHASGPLSWEQEALLTNLRISLHISNDEHLTELRNLISTGNNSYNC